MTDYSELLSEISLGFIVVAGLQVVSIIIAIVAIVHFW